MTQYYLDMNFVFSVIYIYLSDYYKIQFIQFQRIAKIYILFCIFEIFRTYFKCIFIYTCRIHNIYNVLSIKDEENKFLVQNII